MINLKEYEWRWWSQYGEDGILRKLVEIIPPKYKTFVEIGAHFHEANCLRLQQHEKWAGFYFDDFHEFHPLGFYKAWVTAENINNILSQLPLENDFDIFSLDIDGMDFYIWKALDEQYKPRIVIVEANTKFMPDEDAVIPYDPAYRWDGTDWTGCSARAWCNLLQPKGYSLVYIESHGVNMFFVRTDILPQNTFVGVDDLEFLWNQVTPNSHPEDPQHRSFIIKTHLGE